MTFRGPIVIVAAPIGCCSYALYARTTAPIDEQKHAQTRQDYCFFHDVYAPLVSIPYVT